MAARNDDALVAACAGYAAAAHAVAASLARETDSAESLRLADETVRARLALYDRLLADGWSAPDHVVRSSQADTMLLGLHVREGRRPV